MSANEFHKHASIEIGYVHDEAILVTAEIEDQPIVSDNIDGRSELTFDICRSAPMRSRKHRKPCARRSLGLRVTIPKFFEGAASDHLHRNAGYHVTRLGTRRNVTRMVTQTDKIKCRDFGSNTNLQNRGTSLRGA
jgi:hypothetical protein